MDGLDFKELGSYGLILAVVAYMFFRGGPQVWTALVAFVEQREQLLTSTIDRLFKNADEERALYITQMSDLNKVITTELQRERDFHSDMLKEERQVWESIIIGRNKNENGSGTSPRA
jgi:hypothetical protein